MAEALFRKMVEDAGADISVGSAGVGAFDGMGPSQHSLAVMKEENIDISHLRSAQISREMVSECSHIFGMTSGHCEAVKAHFPEAVEKTFVLREFIADEALDFDVPDPIGGEIDDYRLARNLIQEALPSIFRFVTSGNPDA